ncbi:MAG: TIGR04063 family PEP-CTERM/XrtA system glycosyltransferase [Parasphingorhabdus sp.]
MTRILHILDHSLPLHSGYCFRTRAIMKAQIASGLTVAGVTGVRQNQHGYVTEQPLEEFDDLQFFRTLARVQGPSPIREWREVAVLAERIEQVVREWQPDVLHAHSPALNGLAALRVAEKTGLPLVYEIRAFWEDAAVGNGTGKENSPRYWLTRQLENHVVNGADAVAVICEGLRSDLIGRGVKPEKITVSPNGVDLELFGEPPARDESLLAELGLTGKPVLGFIGSFYDYEGLDDLIDALPILQAFHPDVHLLLVGGGPMEETLKKQVERLGIGSAVTFTGRVPHEQVERFYGLMDIMVYPRKAMRLTELVTPLKPLEAMAQGRLVAASDVGGHQELIEDGITGTLFPAGDPEKIAKKLGDLLDNSASWPQVIEAARKFVEADRNWSSNILRYTPVYQRLIERKSFERAA